MRRARLLLTLLAALLVGTAAAGCSRVVAGTPAAAPDGAVFRTPTGVSGSVRVGDASPGRTRPSAPPSVTDDGPTALRSDVVADECLLDTSQLAALLGSPVPAPAQSVVARDDGSRSSSCYAGPPRGATGPMAAINVYTVRTGTPAQFVRAAGGRALRGVGTAATVLETAAGPTLQAATARFLVTVVVEGSDPDDAAWRAAARAALARVPR